MARTLVPYQGARPGTVPITLCTSDYVDLDRDCVFACRKGRPPGLPCSPGASSRKTGPVCLVHKKSETISTVRTVHCRSSQAPEPQASPPPLPPPSPAGQTPPSPEWQLLWADEFDRRDALGPGSCWEAQLGDGTDYHCPCWGNNERCAQRRSPPAPPGRPAAGPAQSAPHRPAVHELFGPLLGAGNGTRHVPRTCG